MSPLLFSQSQKEVFLYGSLQSGSLAYGKAPDAKEIYLNGKRAFVDKDGFFVIGFDRDEKGSQALQIVYADGQIDVKKFYLKKRVYNIQRINKMAEKYVSPPKEVLERIEKESQMMREARIAAEKTDTFFPYSGFIKPIENARQSSVFGSQRILNGVKKDPHYGVDYAAPKGTKIKAAADGVVRFKGDDFYYSGNFVFLDHGFGLTTIYIHMDTVYVKEGRRIAKGDILGEVGTTGRSTGPHLHWGALWYNKRVDPLSLFKINMDKPTVLK
jgi:murein DD-endopeptidase MepM/ murein hydrolase activator NlpD